MFENTRKYLVEYVLPSYQDFLDHRSNNNWGENQLLRKGINAATALFHMREQIPSNIRPTKKDLKNQYKDYGLIADIANVAKHHEIKNDNPKISKSSQIYEVMVYTMFADEQGQYYSPQLDIFVKLDDGTEIKLVNILYNIMLMWRDVLDKLGIISLKAIESLRIDQPLKRDEVGRRNADMSMRQGEEYNWQFRMEKFNYEKNIAEPMDITGMNFQFRISKLPEQVPMCIHITNSKNKIDFNFDFDIPLSKEQATEYISLENDENKIAFLKRIVDSSPNIKNELNNKIKSAIQGQMTKNT
jgi:hypothetical protein